MKKGTSEKAGIQKSSNTSFTDYLMKNIQNFSSSELAKVINSLEKAKKRCCYKRK